MERFGVSPVWLVLSKLCTGEEERGQETHTKGKSEEVE